METLKTLFSSELKSIDEELDGIFIPESNLNRELKSFLNSSSKRIRCLVTILYLKSLDKEITPEVIKVLSAGEIIHNASLMHDDVIDSASLRRGKETIGHKFSPHISILTGDYLLSEAVKKLLLLDNKEILEIFLDCTQKMSQAEIKQYFLRGKMPEPDEYIDILEGKTAALFEAVLESVAVLEKLDRHAAKCFAQKFGIVFQIKNDLQPDSASNDAMNKIYTAKDIFGVEKTTILIDNYLKDIEGLLKEIPDNKYKKELEGLLNKL